MAAARRRTGPWQGTTAVAAALATAAACAIALWHRVDVATQRVCCDVVGYRGLAEAYAQGGLFADHPAAALRTWLYPALLALVDRAAAFAGTSPDAWLFGLQLLAHLGSSALLARVACTGDARRGVVAFALLACNPFAAAYLPVALTDALALSVFQAWLATAIASLRKRDTATRPGGALRWLAACALAAGIAVMLRPAYVWLLPLTLLIAAWPGRGLRLRPARVALALLLPWLAMAPQVAINHAKFDRMTPLPTVDLAGKQMAWGIQHLKYATAPKPGSSALMFYRNPMDTGVGDDAGAGWYLAHPLRGAATLGAKLVGAFDFDYVQAYVHDRAPPLQWLARSVSLALFVAGLFGMALHARRGAGVLDLGPRGLPALVFLGWATVTLASLVELRFTLPMLPLFVLLGMDAIARLRGTEARAGAAWMAAAVVAWLAAWAVAVFVARQNVLL